VGLARLREGLELVRIGRPLRPEFAAWRYGDQFGRRRRRAILYGAGAMAVIGGIQISTAAVGGFGGMGWMVWNSWYNGRTLVKLRPADGKVIKLTGRDLKGARLLPVEGAGGYALEVRKGKKRIRFGGQEAEHHLGRVVLGVNRMGGKQVTVKEAVAEIEEHGHPDAFLADVVAGSGMRYRDKKGVPGYLNKMPAPTKLALEMSLHEEQERRALAGELWLIEEAWKEAEEIAAIADNLLLPEGADEFIARHRGNPTPDVDPERA
jgi:hypothetical protein